MQDFVWPYPNATSHASLTGSHSTERPCIEILWWQRVACLEPSRLPVSFTLEDIL